MGKTQITQLTPFDFISALIIGELVGNAIYNIEIGINYVLYAIFLWGTLITFVEWMTQKWRKTRGFIEGVPSIVIHRGLIDKIQLKKNRLDLNQLKRLLRDEGIFSFQEVEYAILEPNGKLNVLKKFPFQDIKKSDLNKHIGNVTLPITIISDGEWVKENIEQTNYKIRDYEALFNSHGLNVNAILYGEWTEDEPLYLQLYHSPYIKKLQL